MKPTRNTRLVSPLFATAGLIATGLQAAPVIEESFDYSPAGSRLQTYTQSATGLSADWSDSGTLVAAPGFLYGTLATSGNKVTMSDDTSWVDTGTTFDGLLDDGDTLWFSVLVRPHSLSTNPDFGFALATDKGNDSNNVPISNNGSGLGFRFKGGLKATAWSGGSPSSAGSVSGVSAGEVTLIVGRMTFGATSGDADTIDIWLADETRTFDEPNPGSTQTAILDQTAFDTITFMNKAASPRDEVDEIRFGATSADVLPIETAPPSVLSITDDQGGGPIGEDIVIVTYTVSFDKLMDGATITAADFANAGTADATVGTVTLVEPTVVEVQLLPTTTGTLVLRIPSGASLTNITGQDLDTTSDIDDDTTITINAGTTPLGSVRWWDGTTTSGTTNGASDGGTATWDNGTTTNWDAGPGLPAPVAWDNSLVTDAVFGGTGPYTATLAEDIIAGEVSTASGATVALDGNNLSATALSGSGGAVSNGSATTDSTLTVNQSSNTTFSGSINDGAAATTKLVKSGSGDLALRGSSDFTGGLEIAGGRITITDNNSVESSYLGDASNVVTFTADGELYNTNGAVTLPQGITINGGVTGRVTGAFGERTEVDGVLAGSGTLVVQGYSAGYNAEFRNTGNTFTGPIEIRSGDNVVAEFRSLPDSPGATTIGLQSNSNNGGKFIYMSGAIAPLVFDNRQFELIVNGNSGTNSDRQAKIINDASGTNTITIAKDLLITGTGTKKLYLGGGNTDDNAFNGAIPDGVAGAALTLYKENGGKWILGGANTFTGGTVMSGGTLTIDGSLADSSMTVSSGTVNGSGTLTFGTTDQIDISGGTVDLSGLTVEGSGLTDPVYIIIDSVDGGSYTGTFATVNVPGYTVNYNYDGSGTQVALEAASGTTYATWSGGAGADVDTNGDGVENAVAYVLGAADVNEVMTGKVPTLDNTSDPDFFIFNFRRSDDAEADGTTAIAAQYGTDLNGWTTAVDDATDVIITASNDFYDTGVDKVEVKLRRSVLAPDGRLFARLLVTVTP